jgi:hypothetical protein
MNKKKGKQEGDLFMAIALVALGLTIVISMLSQWLS